MTCLFDSRTGKVKRYAVPACVCVSSFNTPLFFAFAFAHGMQLACKRPNDNAHVTRLQIAHHSGRMSEVLLMFARSRAFCVPCMLSLRRIAHNSGYATRLRIHCHNAHTSALLPPPPPSPFRAACCHDPAARHCPHKDINFDVGNVLDF